MKTYSFEQIAKKNRYKNIVLISVISILVTLGILLLAFKFLTKKTWQSLEETREYYDRMHKIAYPNIGYKLGIFEATSEFSGYYYIDRVKNISGIEVPYEDINAPYGVWKRRSYLGAREEIDITSEQTAVYTFGSGHKSPMFYNVAYDYSQDTGFHMKKTQDINLLPQLPNYAVEMAVTFDKPYTLAEIEKKIPDELTISWYWIGTKATEYDTAMLSPRDQIGFSLDPYLVRDGRDVADKEQQEVWQASYQEFRNNLQLALDADWLKLSHSTYKGEIYSLKKDVTSYLQANQQASSATFGGIIVTGRSEHFASLVGKDWVFASNIGETVLIKPYHHLKD